MTPIEWIYIGWTWCKVSVVLSEEFRNLRESFTGKQWSYGYEVHMVWQAIYGDADGRKWGSYFRFWCGCRGGEVSLSGGEFWILGVQSTAKEQCYGVNLRVILSGLFDSMRPLTSVMIGVVVGEYLTQWLRLIVGIWTQFWNLVYCSALRSSATAAIWGLFQAHYSTLSGS